MNILNKNAVENKIFTKCGLKAKKMSIYKWRETWHIKFPIKNELSRGPVALMSGQLKRIHVLLFN